MKYLKRRASRAYLNLTRLSFHLGIIGWVHYLDRLLVLREITNPKDPVHKFSSRAIQIEDWFDEIEWPEDQIEQDKTHINIDSEICVDEDDDENFLYLVVGIKGLTDWVFHQYDDDYFPSIPHGHYRGKSQPKLDPYLGWVYKGSKQITRKPKSIIVKLWNYQKFRDFAALAIEYYINEYPHYTGWSVDNPRRLPKRR